MKATLSDILQFLYNRTGSGRFITLYELEIEFGMTGKDLTALLEDLKELEYVVEVDEGYGITDCGVNFGRSRWV
jgi:hypothetical protein